MGLLDQIIAAESGGDPLARNPRSSASGLGQFIDATWLDILAKNRPDLVEGKTKEQILALKQDPQLSRDMTEAYARENGDILRNSGLPVTPGSTYLAHFAGPKGAVSVLSAPPDAPVASILGDAAVKANPFLAKMTAGDLVAWAGQKVGQPVQQVAQAGPRTAPVSAPAATPATQPYQAPIFPTQAAAQPQQASLWQQMPPPQMPQPLFAQRRKPPDLTALRQALEQTRPSAGFFI